MQNYMHITIHTSQAWADTFISELMDTHVEMELRTKHIPPQVTLKAELDKLAKLPLLGLCVTATYLGTQSASFPTDRKQSIHRCQDQSRIRASAGFPGSLQLVQCKGKV